MKTKLITFLIIFTVLFSKINFAQSFTKYTPSNSGMIGSNVNCGAFDKQGNIWISTWNSGSNAILTKFDGINWTNFIVPTNIIPLNSYFTSIAVDNLNNKWLGSPGNALIKFDGANWTRYDTVAGMIQNFNVSALGVDYQNNLWVCSGSNIAKFNGANWTIFNINGWNIRQIASCQEGAHTVWFTTPDSVLRYSGGIWTTYKSSNTGITKFGSTSIAIDNNNHIWIPDYFFDYDTLRLFEYDGINWKVHYDTIQNLSLTTTKDVNSILIDEFNNKILPVVDINFCVYTTYKDTIFINHPFLASSNIAGFYVGRYSQIDSMGNIWAFCANLGLWKLNCFPPGTPTSIIGPTTVSKGQGLVTYKVPPVEFASSYVWTFPNGFVGTSTTDSITVNIGNIAVSGNITVCGHSRCSNGSAATLNVTVTPMGIDEEYLSLLNIRIYPNPAKDKLTIETNLNSKISYVIENLLGQKIYSSFVTNKATIDVSFYPKGIYILKLNTDKGIVIKKFVKE